MDTKITVLFIIGLVVLLGFIVVGSPLKFLFKVLINSALGICFMLIANYILKDTGIYIGVNEFTSLFVGISGIPGLICLYILKMIL